MREQPGLGGQPAGIAGEAAIGANDAVAGDDERNRIAAIGEADGARSTRLAKGCGERLIAAGLAGRDGAELRPDALLELRAGRRHSQPIKGGELSGEIGGDCSRDGRRRQRRGAGAIKAESGEAAGVIGFEAERAEWRRLGVEGHGCVGQGVRQRVKGIDPLQPPCNRRAGREIEPMRAVAVLGALLGLAPVKAAPLVLEIDAPLQVMINRRPAELQLSSCTVDQIKLNADAAERLRLQPRARDALADLSIGGSPVLIGRHGPASVRAGGRWGPAEVYWFEGVSVLPRDGTLGPHALVADVVEMRLGGSRESDRWSWALVGGLSTCSYAAIAEDGLVFSAGIDMLSRRSLPLVSASLGADLAQKLGGRFEGDIYEEAILMGFNRPVRKMVLGRPLVLGPWRIEAVAVRVGKQNDATARLREGQSLPRDRDADPGEMVVTAK